MLASDDFHHHVENFLLRYVESFGEQFGFAQVFDLLRAFATGPGPDSVDHLMERLRRTPGLDCGRFSPEALVFGTWAGARLAPDPFQDRVPFTGQEAGGMTVALAEQSASFKAEAAQIEPAAVAVYMRTVLMLAENASRGPVVIRPGVWHDHHCTADRPAQAGRRIGPYTFLVASSQPENVSGCSVDRLGSLIRRRAFH
jgi:hypothetical protein